MYHFLISSCDIFNYYCIFVTSLLLLICFSLLKNKKIYLTFWYSTMTTISKKRESMEKCQRCSSIKTPWKRSNLNVFNINEQMTNHWFFNSICVKLNRNNKTIMEFEKQQCRYAQDPPRPYSQHPQKTTRWRWISLCARSTTSLSIWTTTMVTTWRWSRWTFRRRQF